MERVCHHLILDNAIQQGLPLALTFLDLKNAFGSIAHPLIRDMLNHIKLPSQVISYYHEWLFQAFCYSKNEGMDIPSL